MTKKLLSIFVLIFLLINTSKNFAQKVFFNEIHYDNVSTDVAEAIEIAGPARTNLAGWSILLYNGTGGAVYGTISLSGSIPYQQGGYGTVSISYSSGIQNGSPDGMALVDASGKVVQFLSYEGSFTATDGAAIGLTSTDIVVSEGATTPVGYSLQLAGTGSKYSDFTWQSAALSTAGSVNTAQVFQTETVPVVINEFVLNHAGLNTNEYVEVISNPTTDLSQYALLQIEGDGTGAGIIDGVIYLGTTDANGIYVSPYLTDYFENNSLSLLVVKNFNGNVGDDLDTNDDGTLDVRPWELILDDVAVSDGDAGDLFYSAVVLSPGYDGEPAVVGGASRIPNGSDSNLASDWVRNDFDGQGLPSTPDAVAKNGEAINTAGAENQVASVAGNFVINEVDSDTPGADALEFIELYDGGVGKASLNGYVVVLYNGSNDKSYAAYDLTGFSTNKDGYFVLGNSAVQNVSYIFSNNILQNGADAVALYKGTAAQFPNGTAVTTTNLVDALVYDTDDDDDAGLLVLLNEGQAQINESGSGNSAAYSMQRILNGDGGARNTSSYMLLLPSPGTINGGTVPTETVNILEARAANDGNVVMVSGVLTVSDQFNGAAYLQDASAGIAVFDAKVHGKGLFNIGDSITVTGIKTTYNGQIEISPVVEVVNNGLPNKPILPVDITLSEMSSHQDELVRVLNPTFAKPGDMLFGNSNYVISDASGTGLLRIDADAPGLPGLAQPQSCQEIIGIAGRYYEVFQLLPRIPSDMACAEKYQATGSDISISKDLTLDVAAWNIEWFGDESNSPVAGNVNSDQIQKESVKNVILNLDADVIGVEEISDDALFAQMVSEMPGYAYVLSDATSYPNTEGVKQKVGFIYKTSCISPVSTKVLLASIHPYYNGGITTYLSDYPADADRFYASGRLPFMLTADVKINGTTKRVSFIDLHARANSTDAQACYDMRKYDVEVLKDTLDTYYANDNIVMVGDYNDDVDVTVADVTTTVSTYQAYVDDPANYSIPTSVLSANGFRSYVTEENMIDHIMISNELNNNLIQGSTRVHYELYDYNYTKTTSDHMPVSARFQTELLSIAGVESTSATCNGNADGTATVNVKGGIEPYSYVWSNGQTSQTATNLKAASYQVTVTDILGNSVSTQVTVSQPNPLAIEMIASPTVYKGYPYASCADLSAASVNGGTPGYSYRWSNGATTEITNVCPGTSTTYTLTVTDANSCSASANVMVKVIDIRCKIGISPKVIVCYYGITFCMPVQLVPYLLGYGVKLGSCCLNKSASVTDVESFEEMQQIVAEGTKVFPNPFTSDLNITISSNVDKDIELLIYNTKGQLVHSESQTVYSGVNKLELQLDDLNPGMYILRTVGLQDNELNTRIVKK